MSPQRNGLRALLEIVIGFGMLAAAIVAFATGDAWRHGSVNTVLPFLGLVVGAAGVISGSGGVRKRRGRR